jgi:hypothetical protein
MSFTFARPAAGFALLAVLAAGCGTAAAAHSAPTPAAAAHSATPTPAAAAHSATPAPAATHHHHHARPRHAAVTTPATAPAQTANPIPQGNGGDQDADNNGGPSDGDGNI